ncbi:PEP-CTERM sorting domain-containing protein [Nostoc sp. CHAB 5844]|nr:PEP-CTERM sorting domain-containing protein [Nostoc sp. CHAB 5844]
MKSNRQLSKIFLISPTSISKSLVNIGMGAVILAGAASAPALADPVPIPDLPTVFCFRFTDSQLVPGDVGNDRIQFEFEVLNWTNTRASGVDIALNQGNGFGGIRQARPFFAGADVDPNGRPIGTGDDGLPPGNLNIPNDWRVDSITPGNQLENTAIEWRAGTPINNIDLLGGERPSFLNPNDPETIDNGNNVLDGFTFTADDLDVGEVLSFNWFLKDVNDVPIGSVGGGNAYGFGTVNITRITAGNPLPGIVLVGNTGFNQSPNLFYDQTYDLGDGTQLAAEFGAGITARFQNPNDNPGVRINTEPVPEPITVIGSAAAFGFGTIFKKRFAKKQKNIAQIV